MSAMIFTSSGLSGRFGGVSIREAVSAICGAGRGEEKGKGRWQAESGESSQARGRASPCRSGFAACHPDC